jgi:phage shock protein A
MQSLSKALERLATSVERLERALPVQEARVVQREGELNAALQDARDGQARAQEKVDEVSQRLDAAIERLETVLEAR